MTKQQQRREALDKANAVRTARKEIRERIAVGEADAKALLLDPPEVLSGMPVEKFLRWLPRIGRSRAAQILREQRLSPSISVDRLSPATRERILARL